jgi:argininosuccinate synthase
MAAGDLDGDGDPDLAILAPLREWDLRSREQEISYAQEHRIPVPVSSGSPYSLDRNLWGLSVECGPLEDPTREPPPDTYFTVTPLDRVPDEPTYVDVEFDRGVPRALDGTPLPLPQLIRSLNERGGTHGVGRIDLIENRLVGIKSREIYEAPAVVILHLARTELERLVLDRDTFRFKQLVAARYADLVYNGLWYSPLRGALDAFVDHTQGVVSGTVKIKLWKGNALVAGRRSPFSRYRFNLATYGREDAFDQTAAAGFIKLWGLPLQAAPESVRQSEE